MDPVRLAVEILQEGFPNVPVGTEVPNDRPGRLVTVALDSMSTDGLTTVETLGIVCWGLTDPDACGMCARAADLLREAAEEHPFLFAAQLDTMARDLWTATGQSRYIAQVSLFLNED